MNSSQVTLADALRAAPLLADLEPQELQWLADHAEEVHYAAGEIPFPPGAPAEYMVIILEGEIQAAPESTSPNVPIYIAGAGQITGLLPHSRMTHYSRAVAAVEPTRIARIHKKYFQEMLTAIPRMGPKLVGVMADRIRDTTKADIQYEKLAALGKLSAGLAHELNNPASAARRASASLRTSLDRLREANEELHRIGLNSEIIAKLAAFEAGAIQSAAACTGLDALTRSDREERVGAALTKLGIRNAWDYAPELVDAGLDEPKLAEIAVKLGPEALPPVLTRLASTLAVYQLAEDIEDSTTRIAELVRAIKEYSWMDVAPERELDIHDGIENTLTMLHHRLKKDIRVERDYDRDLPRILANGSELNQVWTNLIDNAIEAMQSVTGEKLLRIHTARQGSHILIEIFDTGPGIPPEVQDRIFEPFFTTKPQGQGTGLGLDLVFRIVRKHHGDIRFQSRPGRTCFQVRLPVKRMVPPPQSTQEPE